MKLQIKTRPRLATGPRTSLVKTILLWRVVPCLMLALLIVGCGLVPAHKGSPPEATIAIDSNHFDLQPALRRTLTGMGWALLPTDLSEVEGRDPSLAERATYRIEDSSARVQACTAASGLFAYRLRVIDNASGEVTLELSGTGCELAIGERLERHMRRENLLPR